MRVVIAGGHGKIALILERLLSSRGDEAVGLIRNPA
ncbi:NAD-dependent dehydratase, partial [Mycolicibacterium fortuitum]|nr:NAD-dependent dehydratase [Mycolicibacterium fortuitum]